MLELVTSVCILRDSKSQKQIINNKLQLCSVCSVSPNTCLYARRTAASYFKKASRAYEKISLTGQQSGWTLEGHCGAVCIIHLLESNGGIWYFSRQTIVAAPTADNSCASKNTTSTNCTVSNVTAGNQDPGRSMIPSLLAGFKIIVNGLGH